MVKIITDTTSCIPVEYAVKNDITVIPQMVSFGDESFYEGVDIDNTEFMSRLRSFPDLPKTAAPPPELFREVFERLVPTGEPILCIHPSSDVSGTIRSVETAALDFPGADIRIIDTRLVAGPLATMVELAVSWVKTGDQVNAIETRLRGMIPYGRIYFLVATLEYLAKGGRIGGAAALVGSMLQIKPILALQEGKVDQYDRERTHKRALARLVEIVCEQYPRGKDGYLSVMHANVPDEGAALADELNKHLSIGAIPIYDVPPVITTHGGPGILGAGFFV